MRDWHAVTQLRARTVHSPENRVLCKAEPSSPLTNLAREKSLIWSGRDNT
jgi:hypothetical protein